MQFQIPDEVKKEINRIFENATHKWSVGDGAVTILRHNAPSKKGRPIWYVLHKGDFRNLISEYEERKNSFSFRSVTDVFGYKTLSHSNGKKVSSVANVTAYVALIPILEKLKETLKDSK
jgi:hypothetical protein